MAGSVIGRGEVDCLSPEGRRLAVLEIIASGGRGALAGEEPLLLLGEDEAMQRAEERLQLRERGRYQYRLHPAAGISEDLCLLAGRGVTPSLFEGSEDTGLLEPRDYCGLLPLVVVKRGDASEKPVARAAVEVRSVKIGYRDHYRGMLNAIAEKCANLLTDSRASTQLRMSTLWQRDALVLEQQLEFLRYSLEMPSFAAAIDEILRNPHRRLESDVEDREISRPMKHGRDFASQIARASRRTVVPITHPLRERLSSLPSRVRFSTRVDFLDTAENRFAKMVLSTFRDFVADVGAHLQRQILKTGANPESRRLLRETSRLRSLLDSQLARGFLPSISVPTILPIGSPVLQRRTGYRELLYLWLQFHAGAQLVWKGGADVFHAGSRNVATLYEYWLFFELEALFRKKFNCDQPLHELIINREAVPPQMVLQRGVSLRAPITGSWSKTTGRAMQATFHFNRRFAPLRKAREAGSWTRAVRPDYTISIWPSGYSSQEAEDNELMVHVHFDAKYRVERVREILGDASDDEEPVDDEAPASEASTLAKYDDLLKMHAYRDAIRRSAGAYVIYPGFDEGFGTRYKEFHEVLPGLGAFAVRPTLGGRAEGMDAVSRFLDEVIEHVADRATARERVTYHIASSYSESQVRERSSTAASMPLSESDPLWDAYRAPPPKEDMVLVAWYETQAQLELSHDRLGITFVRLGTRRGALRVHPNLAQVRHILMRTHGGVVANGLLLLRRPGFEVLTRSQLRMRLNLHALAKRKGVADWQNGPTGMEDEIYAVFETSLADGWAARGWNGSVLMDEIERFESDERNRPIGNVGRLSPNPRILSLADVLRASVSDAGI